MTDAILRTENLKKSFGKLEVLKGITTEIRRGEVVSIIGPSGGGKSTFLRCLNLLEQPTSGQILFDGTDICSIKGKAIDQCRQRMGMVFQQFNLFNNMDVMHNLIAAPTRIKGMSQEEAQDKALSLLSKVGLADRADAYPSQLSGGQKQRVAIAGVIAMEPACIVLDEATAMLDPVGRQEVLSAVHKLNREKGITVVLITHHINEAEDADRVIVMDDGQVVLDGGPREVFTKVEALRSMGLTVPDTIDLLDRLRRDGVAVPPDALTVEECADAIAAALGKK